MKLQRLWCDFENWDTLASILLHFVFLLGNIICLSNNKNKKNSKLITFFPELFMKLQRFPLLNRNDQDKKLPYSIRTELSVLQHISPPTSPPAPGLSQSPLTPLFSQFWKEKRKKKMRKKPPHNIDNVQLKASLQICKSIGSMNMNSSAFDEKEQHLTTPLM